MTVHYCRIDLPVSAVFIGKDDKIYTASPSVSENETHLLVLDPSARDLRQIASLEGRKSFLLNVAKDRMFVGVNNKLFMEGTHGSWQEVLSCGKLSNFFWHMAISNNKTVYVQEYGEPPTAIYKSVDGKHWSAVVTCSKIDKSARHFHNIACDQYRDMLIATLGDRNLVRVAASTDGGEKWKSVYKGAWQVLPLVVLQDRIIFGMDSGFARGGLVTWFPDEERFEACHLKWTKDDVRSMQMVDLKLLSNNTWVAALGVPQAIIASSNLKQWSPVCVEGFSDNFRFSMAVAEGKNILAFVTGKSLWIVNKKDLAAHLDNAKPTICQYKPLFLGLKGLAYTLKRNACKHGNRQPPTGANA